MLIPQPTFLYSHWIRGHSFLCASISLQQTIPIKHLLGQGKGSLGHPSLCLPSINWCSPVSWQWRQLTVRRKHSVSTWSVRYCRSIVFPHSLEHCNSSNRQRHWWLLMSFNSPCHLQWIWNPLISRSIALLRNVLNSSSWQLGQALASNGSSGFMDIVQAGFAE